MAQDAHPTVVAGVVLLAFAVSGCAGKGAYPSFAVDSIPPFSGSGHAVAEERWWKEFGDAGLDGEVNLALTGNFDLTVALQRLRAARAVTRREASDFFPDVNGLVDIGHTFQSGQNQTRTTWGLDASYQLDLWGQIQARVDAEQFRADATEADYHTVALSLAAEVSRTWFSLIESYAQLDLLDEQLDSNRTAQKNVELRFATGGSGGSPDVLRQRQLVQSTLEQIIVVKANIEVLEHQLAVLTGQPPQTATYSPGSVFPDLPPLPTTGLPSDLLNRRPDVRRAYLAFSAAERDLEAAVTDQYPRLNLRASLVNAAEHPESLFRDWFLSIGGQLIGPILDGGQRRAEVERARAVMHQRFAEYRQTTQIALQEVEDGLALERYQIQRIEKLQDQLDLAKLASEQLSQRIITDDASFLDVLSAIQSQQRLQRAMLSARLDLILIRIGLYLALAGDFDTRPDPATELPETFPVSPPLLPPEPGAPESDATEADEREEEASVDE
tara:strand:- start:122107 stop:123603 length:1497 start_codon:yes stop_codon:yes gene_type:complete